MRVEPEREREGYEEKEERRKSGVCKRNRW